MLIIIKFIQLTDAKTTEQVVQNVGALCWRLNENEVSKLNELLLGTSPAHLIGILNKISSPATVTSNLHSETVPNLEGVKALIVDDESDTRELLGFLLQEYKASVKLVASATDALNIFSQYQPNILLSDLGMPEMDGYSLIRQIRTIPPEQGGDIPAIAITAFATDDDIQKVVAAGFNRHIAKPVQTSELVTLVAELVISKVGIAHLT